MNDKNDLTYDEYFDIVQEFFSSYCANEPVHKERDELIADMNFHVPLMLKEGYINNISPKQLAMDMAVRVGFFETPQTLDN